MIRIKTNLLNPVSHDAAQLRKNCVLTIDGERIARIDDSGEFDIDYGDCVCLPGMIDAHVHLSQYHVRGMHAPHLIQWLDRYIFPEEAKSFDPAYARATAEAFFDALIKAGTTTAVIYVSASKEATEIAFQVAEQKGVRAVIGKVMMDTNSPEALQEDPKQSIRDSLELYDKWHGKTPLLDYVFSPRFAPVCSSGLMREIGQEASRRNAYIQTHLSENLDEIKWVEKLFPACGSYTEVYDRAGILTDRTLLGHCLHLSEEEIGLIRVRKSKIIHCPDSNFFLKSGVFPWRRIEESGIDFALASDVGAGTTLSMPQIMKMAIYRQEIALSPEEAFYRATVGGAKALSRENDLGMLKEGMLADMVFMRMPVSDAREVLSRMIYLTDSSRIVAVYIHGNQVN